MCATACSGAIRPSRMCLALCSTRSSRCSRMLQYCAIRPPALSPRGGWPVDLYQEVFSPVSHHSTNTARELILYEEDGAQCCQGMCGTAYAGTARLIAASYD